MGKTEIIENKVKHLFKIIFEGTPFQTETVAIDTDIYAYLSYIVIAGQNIWILTTTGEELHLSPICVNDTNVTVTVNGKNIVLNCSAYCSFYVMRL